MGVNLGLSHEGKNIDWGYPRTGCWGEYLYLKVKVKLFPCFFL